MSVVHARDRSVLVTGAASGIGKAIAAAFARRGSRVVLLDRDPAVRDVAGELGAACVGFVVDVASEQAVDEARAAIGAAVGSIDVLVNNAGISRLATADTLAMSDWDAVLATNLRGSFLCARAFGPDMAARGWGRIVQVASQNATCGIARHVAYSAAKTGLLGMVRVLAVEWGSKGVTANAVSPTMVDTAMRRKDWSEAEMATVAAMIPAGRLPTTDEVAAAAVYLASEEAAMINGQNLLIDGGFSIIS